MKLWKSSILLIGLVVILGTISIPVSAEIDPPEDLWHWYYTETNWGWGEATGHPNIDITDVSYTKDGLDLTISMTVSGNIQTAENIIYMIYSGDPEETYYWVMYMNGVGTWGATGVSGYTGGMLTNPISADGKTLTATFTLVEDTTISPYANAIEYSQSGDMATSEWWQDWYPNEHFQGYSGDGDGDDDNDDDASGTDGTDSTKGTPGFEALAVIAALGVAFIILRRKK